MTSIDRRKFLGASVLAGATLASPVRVSASAPLPENWLVSIAKRELQRNARFVRNQDRVALVDFTLPSRDPRFFIVDMMSGTISAHLTTHGRGSDPDHIGWLRYFSPQEGSLASSRGAYVTGDQYYGKNGLSLRLQGLDPDNYTAEQRAIVVHGAWYADPSLVASTGKLGRSEGCFAFAEYELPMMLERLGTGRLIFADRL